MKERRTTPRKRNILIIHKPAIRLTRTISCENKIVRVYTTSGSVGVTTVCTEVEMEGRAVAAVAFFGCLAASLALNERPIIGEWYFRDSMQ